MGGYWRADDRGENDRQLHLWRSGRTVVLRHHKLPDVSKPRDWFRLVRRTFAQGSMPYITLVGNKTDLNHMRAVKVEKHNQFAEENEMCSAFMSAKSGDSVSSCFYRIAADLAGVVLTKPELEVASKIVKAEIINHPQDEIEQQGMPPPLPGKKNKGSCVIS